MSFPKRKFRLLFDVVEFLATLRWYVGKKLFFLGTNFEEVKGILVDLLKARRGVYHRHFLHAGLVVLVIVGVFSTPLLANRYPTAASSGDENSSPSVSIQLQDLTQLDVTTQESQKPRRDVVEHEVKGGETLSSIAKDYGVNAESIAYLNNFSVNKLLRPGDKIKIPPVIGVVVKVQRGDTIYSLAEKYNLPTPQPIVDWPYNTFVDDEKFTLAVGQTLVVPAGTPPKEIPAPASLQKTPEVPLFARGSGIVSWPTQGVITQYFTFYHNGIDIANSQGTNIAAADSGRVVSILYETYGYGYHIIIDHGNGYKTLYAHLSRIDVSVGDNVSRGQHLALMGSTGRSTGPHLHFVVFRNDSAMNPLGVLK